ncbi:MAG: creatininase family protein [Candidatus Altiarchaeota archaeon]
MVRLCDCPSPSASGGAVVIPVGSFEQHGPHLPLSTDTLISEAVAAAVAKKLKAYVGPTIQFGVSPEHMNFPGTITLAASTFKNVVSELVGSLRRHGFSEIMLVNGHGGNNKPLGELACEVKVVNLTSLIKPYDHAGEVETSLMMHLHPKLVVKDSICEQQFTWPGKMEWADTKEFSESGVLGHPHKASKKKGKAIFDELVEKTLKELS